MDRNTVLRWALIAIGIIAFWKWGMPLVSGKHESAVQPLPAEVYANAPTFEPDVLDAPGPDGKPPPAAPPEGELCHVVGNRFDAVLSSRGAGIKHFYLKDLQYADSAAADMSTTPDHERWRSLRTLFRGPEGASDDATEQLKYDRFDWQLEKLPSESGCRFTYADDGVKIVKTVTAGARPFELEVETTITNLASAPKKHRFTIEDFAYRKIAEVKSHLGRVSPFLTDLECADGKNVTRKNKDDFKEGWLSEPADRYAAIGTTYFAQALVPDAGPGGTPTCQVLSEDWYGAGQARDDDEAGNVYHARLAWPTVELQPNASATYKVTSFTGPKERHVLAHAAGGKKGLSDLINLGFFTPVAKYLVLLLEFFHDHITFGNWGAAIILMTFGLRLFLFPLTWKSIKTTIGMRRLKPEVDALNAKFKDDPQAKNMAMMELWRKNGVSPFGGCLPQLVQMPIWWAMYTTLQTAVELYHVKFLWFTDLSAPDKFYVLPIVLGVFMILQQRIVPQQGMDPMQQKMMMYLLPGVFTVMMLFLPSALGVYMLTNSVLGISQQLAVEQFAPRKPPPAAGIVVREATANDMKVLGKGKARV